MRKNITFLLLLTILFSCSKKQDNFSKYEWLIHYKEYNEDYSKSTSHQKVLFKNDSIVCFSEITGKSMKFPLIKKDSLIIFKELYTITRKGEKKKDTIVTDTLLFDFKKLFDKPLLIIKPLKSEYYNVLTTSKNNIELEETNNFLSLINFKIGGMQIGDSISIQNFENIKDKKTYDDTNILVGNPKGNENIEAQIINKKYIYSITQKNIANSQIENIIKVVNEKIKINPDTIKKSKPFYTEGYRWNSKGIEVELKKDDIYQYYMDKAEEITKSDFGSQMRKSTYIKMATKEIGNGKYYELEYNNELVQNILRIIGNKTTQSSIIE
ncbi:hypothetical protein M4I21_18035 [Cellulophaga sp. 20_2_10]|uniref:hypothetical protein n=1 Tax=Cellulophaga sp. 20_2_10 TaxID=2942476 RepID=UPI00201A327D|nr:hypothetical protein [Cellulophaga sp. 20_2_10]MCL5247718.1 hypothetical protein [Cellulophaga sp. 20_2_10]